jgi:hypothetical protein
VELRVPPGPHGEWVLSSRSTLNLAMGEPAMPTDVHERKGHKMTKPDPTAWPWRFALLGLALSIPVACGKSSSHGGVEAGAGGGAGGSIAVGDANSLDAPMATAGNGQPDAAIAGSIAIDAPNGAAGAGGGGGFGTGGGAMAGTGGGSTGPARPDGGLGGAGATGGVTGNAGATGGKAGSVGGGTSGSAAGTAGSTGGRSALAGASGQLDAVDAAWFANDAGIKNCPESLVSGNSLKCEVGSPSICVVAGTYDTYHCSEGGWWVKNPDHCPGLLTTGDTCTGEFICLYPSYWFCQCPGMGFPATCGDIRTTSTLLVPRDAGPDTNKERYPTILPCPENPQGAACDSVTYPQGACVRGNSIDLCTCVSGTFSCPTKACPAVVDTSMPCEASDMELELNCLKDGNKICRCILLRSGSYLFSCG